MYIHTQANKIKRSMPWHMQSQNYNNITFLLVVLLDGPLIESTSLVRDEVG